MSKPKNNNQVDKIKEIVSVRDFLQDNGFELPSDSMINCLFHEDSQPSMFVDEEYCYCHACAKSWDVVDVARKVWDSGFKPTTEKLLRDYGGDVQQAPSAKPAEERKQLKKKSAVITPAQRDAILESTSAKGNGYRGISDKTLKRSGVRTEYNTSGEVVARYYPVTEGFKLTGYKKRICDPEVLKEINKKKSFTVIGKVNNESDLYGAIFYKGGGKTLLIVGGEEDREACIDMLESPHFKDYWVKPCVVSPVTGEGGLKNQLKSQYNWINTFDEIVLALDSDDAGKAHMEECAELIPKEKLYTITWQEKDPNDYLTKGKDKEFVQALFNKQKYVPKGIVSSVDIDHDLIAEITADRIPLPAYQKEMQDKCLGGFPLGVVVNIAGISGGGKCLGKDTPVLMHDMSVKKVQDVLVGDILMGDDGSPRNVLSVTSGREALYKVSQVKGDPYIVNESHILSLRVKDEVVDIELRDFLKLPRTIQTKYKGYKGSLVKLSNADTHFDPYLLGLWLADGTSSKAQITFNWNDVELIEYVQSKIDALGYGTNICPTNDRENCYMLDISGGFMGELREMGILSNKHIPDKYLTAPMEKRLALAAGILDGDGYLTHTGATYEVLTKSSSLADSYVKLFKSLGMEVSKSAKFSKCAGFEGAVYHRLFISGHTDIIPVRLERKKAAVRKSNKTPTNTGINIEKISDDGEYFGFEIDGNKRFCLGDFTVTHNTTHINEMIYHWCYHSPYTILPVSLELSTGQYAEVMYSRHLGIRLNRHRDTIHEILENNKEKILDFKYKENGDPRFYLIDDRNLSIQELKAKIKEAVVTLGVKVVIFDPLNDLFEGLSFQDQTDWMKWEKQFVKSCNATIINVCHLNKVGSEVKRDSEGRLILPSMKDFDGASHIFKSGAINIVIARDASAEDPIERNTTVAGILKGRGGIDTGPCGEWYYNPETHTVIPLRDFLAKTETNLPNKIEAEEDNGRPF